MITRVFASGRGRTIGGARVGLPHQRLRRMTIDNHTLIHAEPTHALDPGVEDVWDVLEEHVMGAGLLCQTYDLEE